MFSLLDFFLVFLVEIYFPGRRKIHLLELLVQNQTGKAQMISFICTCPGHHGQLISQNCVFTKIRAEPPPPPPPPPPLR